MSSSRIDSEKPPMVSDSSNPDSLFSTKTPDKSAILPTRSRNSDVSVLFPEIKPQTSRDPNLLIKPVKRQIFSSPRKPEIIVKLPETFEILEECFNGLVTAIRLLKLKGSSTTFANICPKIQHVTNRIFSYGDLAQMKHIYPEAIDVIRVLKYDEGTSCMEPSLHISLNTDAIVLEDTNCGTKYMELRKVFHSKLVDFYKAHPKDEIPKELLPEPFNSPKTVSYSDTKSVDAGAPKLEVEEFDVHMEEMEQEQCIVDKVIPDLSLSAGTEECLSSDKEPRIVGTPFKDLSTPSKELSTPIRLMSATPTLQPSRRCITMTPDDDDDDDSVRSTNGLERRPSRTRCLNFDTREEEGVVKDEVSNESDDKSVDEEGVVKDEVSNESDDKSVDEEGVVKDEVSNESDDKSVDDTSDEDGLLHSIKERPKAESVKHNLPTLVDLIYKLFHSTKRTIITKEELLHKIIASQINITDRREVEEQLSLMLQLVPDWISETKASSGDFLVRINRTSAAENIREDFEEATSRVILKPSDCGGVVFIR